MEDIRRVTQLRWRSFLSTQEGQEGLTRVREMVPRVNRGDAHQMVFDAGRIEGFNECLDRIIELIGVKEDKKSENFDNV